MLESQHFEGKYMCWIHFTNNNISRNITMKNIVKNVLVVIVAVTLPTAASLAVMGAIVSGINHNTIQQSEISK